MLSNTKIFLSLCVLLIVSLYWEDFKYISTISFSFSNDSLGPLVFLASGYIVWINKDRLKSAPVTPNLFGIIGIIISILINYFGLRAGITLICHLSFILFLLSSVLYLYGFNIAKILIFPIVYTIFVIPINFIRDIIGVPLRFFVSTVSTGLFNILGMKAERVGTSIYLDNFSFDIAAPCSGINSLISLLALAAIFAYIIEKSNIKRSILFLSAIPIAVIVNIIRVTSIGLVAKGLNKEIALSLYHDYSGYFLFIMSLTLLYFEKKALDLAGKPQPESKTSA